MELPEIKKALADRAEAVCRHLLPGGKLSKNEWLCGDLSGCAGESLKIVVHGDKAGLWKDFAGTAGSANLLELWVQARGLQFQDALKEAKAWLETQGVRIDSTGARGVPSFKPKAYAKPSTKGLTRIADKAQFYLTAERLIPLDIITLYKIAGNEQGDAMVFGYLSEVAPHPAQMIKFLKLERNEAGKKETWTSANTPKVLFGKHTVRADDRFLLISEGEIDAMTWRAQGIPGLCCTSVPFGAKWEAANGSDPNDEWIGNDWDFIHRFERIYLSFDMDDPGKKACESIIKRLGREVCYVVNLPLKDANDVLRAGRGPELRTAFDTARTLDPATLKNAADFRAAVLDRMYSADPDARRGVALPFAKDVPFHLRWNEWTVLTGINGSGKTQCLGFLLLWLHRLGYASCVGSFEVPVVQTLEFYVRQAAGEKLPEREKAERCLDWIAGGFWFYDNVGRTSWQDVLASYRYAYRRYGVRFFVIDSWMKLGIDPDDLTVQGDVATAFSDFVRDCDVHLFVVAHPKKQKDVDSAPGKMDVKGSGELTDQAHNVLVMWRNEPKELEIERMIKFKESETDILNKRKVKPDAILSVKKQRNDDGEHPTIDLWFHKEAKHYYGKYVEKAMCFLEETVPDEVAAPTPEETHGEDVPF